MGWGVNTALCIVAAVSIFGLASRRTFFLYIDPLTHGGGPGSQLRVPPAPPYGPLPVSTWPFSHWVGCLVTLEKFSKFDFFRNPSVAPRMGLGDHLVTIRAPMGTRVVATGPSSPSCGPPKSFKIAVFRWFGGIWCVRKLLNKQFSTIYRSKVESFSIFFDILTIHNDEISNVKHFSDPLCVFFTLFGCFGR